MISGLKPGDATSGHTRQFAASASSCGGAGRARTADRGPLRAKPAVRQLVTRSLFAGRGFTLVEMVVVVSIILIIVAMVVPAVTTLWAQRRAVEAENTVQGLLMTARARAMEAGGVEWEEVLSSGGFARPVRAGGVESGLLFFVDDQGVQRIISIANVGPPAADLEGLSPNARTERRLAYGNVFAVTGDREQAMPASMRVVPRYAVDDPGGDPAGWSSYSDDELANNDFDAPPSEGDPSQRHRNFFAIVYSTEGQLLVNRDVLIQDSDKDEDGRGDRTGMRVGPGFPDAAETTQYYARNGEEVDIYSGGADQEPLAIGFLVVEDKDDSVAINFPSVDGLLVYDDSLFRALSSPTDKRSYLADAGQPLYVSRWTGVVIRGPTGETKAETP